jgi:undecaprenyl-diphosphatase
MEIYKAIILGTIQGVTEFFPISSTAHLILFPWIFGWNGQINTLTFDVALHSGTLASLLLCFYKEWIEIFLKKRKLFFLILIATVPAAISGLILNNFIENNLRNPIIIVFTLIFFGFLMLIAERYYNRTTIAKKDLSQLSFSDSIFVGVAQAFALIPGVSRSGITITAGIFRNLPRDLAARFSFLMSTPVIFGATILEGRKIMLHSDKYNMDLFVAGFLSAFLSGYLAIRFLMYFLKRYPLNIFVYYRFMLAVIILAVYLTKGI